jgi:threonine/homoserine/homoserine lactone efflux protein
LAVGELIGTVLPLALVVGLSPLPIMPAILLLMTPRARGNGPAYLAAFSVSLVALVLVALWLAGLGDPEPADEQGIGWIQVATGAAFLVMAAFKWVRRPRPGEVKDPPGWMAALSTYTPRQSTRLGVLLAAANPKILVMALAAGAEIAVLAEDAAATTAGVALFVVVGSIGVAIPVLVHAVLGERAAPGLERGRLWLERNATALSVGVLVLLGVLLLLKGLPVAL